jgi:hypothetical protein
LDSQPVERTLMTGEDFYRSGLLYYVNTTVMWPLGLAFRVTRNKDGSGFKDKFDIISIEPPQVIVDGDPIELDHPRYRAANWIAQRLASMSRDECVLASELLSDPNNVAAFLTSDPDAIRARGSSRDGQ